MADHPDAVEIGTDRHISPEVFCEGFQRGLYGYALFSEADSLLFCSASLTNLISHAADQLSLDMPFDSFLQLFEDQPGISRVDDAEQQIYRLKLPIGQSLELCVARLSCGQRLVTAFDKTDKYRRLDALSYGESRFKSFATLATDWFWELDKNLCYLYHSGHNMPLSGDPVIDLVGQNRIATMAGKVIEDDQFKLHNRLLREQQRVDVVLSWRNGEDQMIYSRIRAEPKFNSAGQFDGYMGCGSNVTHFKQLSLKLEYLAMHDDLTLLMNRRCFNKHLDILLAEKSYLDKPYTLCFIDLDHFKMVNDDGGHGAGDSLLRELSGVFRQVCGPDSTIARLGGDEFAVLLNTDRRGACSLMETLIERIATTEFVWHESKYTVGASVGIVEIDGSCSISSELLSRVDIACYHAKRSGRNQVQVYDRANSQQNAQKREQEQASQLRAALAEGKLALFLQPIVPSSTEFPRVHHFEALLRLRDQKGAYHSCGALIPAAEKYGLMQQIDQWVLAEVLEGLKTVNSDEIPVSVSVNLSGNSLSNPDYLEKFAQQIVSSTVDPSLLCFEITETSAILNIDGVINFINKMKSFGCRFALDDFGSGFSSFSYLKAFPIDYLKLDGSFVRDIKSDEGNLAIVSAFNQLSHDLGIQTVAEFVEDQETTQILVELGIDFLQGFGIGAPTEMRTALENLNLPLLKAG